MQTGELTLGPETKVGLCILREYGEHLIVDSPVPFAEWKVREFARLKICHGTKAYYVSRREEAAGNPPLHRYMLSPWPESEGGLAQTIFFDEDYASTVEAAQSQNASEQRWYGALLFFIRSWVSPGPACNAGSFGWALESRP